MRVVGLIRDCGDGSCGMRWLTDIEKAKTLLDDDNHCETYGCNEGSFAADITLPDNIDLSLAGFYIDNE